MAQALETSRYQEVGQVCVARFDHTLVCETIALTIYS